MNTVHPHSRLIDDLGGPTQLAKLLRVRPQAVSQWRRSGVPAARMQLLELLYPAEVGKLANRHPVGVELIGTEGAPPVPLAEVSERARDAA